MVLLPYSFKEMVTKNEPWKYWLSVWQNTKLFWALQKIEYHTVAGSGNFSVACLCFLFSKKKLLGQRADVLRNLFFATLEN